MTENAPEPTGRVTSERLDTVEAHVHALAQALRALAEGLEHNPTEEPGSQPDPVARGARLAHELLLAEGL
ncbi:hypothetical protein [Yinghuangia sp. YIM S10712]|uniref:hypothetical protein n=1 Tax=Yinghuangia sp. YIM S10712 TaxID=3436930 RepID=UPI003F5392E7